MGARAFIRLATRARSATTRPTTGSCCQELEGVPEQRRGARYQCVIALVRTAEDPDPLIARGVWEGRILEAPQGHNGFGYDPLFYVPTHGCASAELEPDVKNGISHRGAALHALIEHLQASA